MSSLSFNTLVSSMGPSTSVELVYSFAGYFQQCCGSECQVVRNELLSSLLWLPGTNRKRSLINESGDFVIDNCLVNDSGKMRNPELPSCCCETLVYRNEKSYFHNAYHADAGLAGEDY